jgi:aminoglycoside phosphotransferase family enzyme/predicted kinase
LVGEQGIDQARLVAALREPGVFEAGQGRADVLETHISYVLLTGTHAYKIKKAVDFGFLDFTTLSARKFFCEQELRLNRRLAPDLYLGVVAITGSFDAPVIGGDGLALEYAVRMREFPQDALAGRLLARNELGAADIDALAAQVAAFHAAIDVAPPYSPFGAPDAVLQLAMQNFAQLRPLAAAPEARADIDALAAWTEREYIARQATFHARQQGGFIRECHGDLHLGNIARIDGKLTIFDCIEFNDAMRWIDVMSEVAFVVMDLQDRKRADLAWRFLNAYLENTGDYAGLAVLRFYLTYRAMVRAKIDRLRAAQLEAGEPQSSVLEDFRGYVELARAYAQPPQPGIVITHGFAGCGKTTLSQALLETLGAVRIRSDVERKRLHGLASREHPRAGIDRGLYTPAATDATYRRVHTLARDVVAAGFPVIVDAAFLHRWQRDLFRTLASDMQVPFAVVSFSACESTLRERIALRAASGRDASDADLAVLEHQLRTHEPLGPDERTHAIVYDAEAPLQHARTPEAWLPVLTRLARAEAADRAAPERSPPPRGEGIH